MLVVNRVNGTPIVPVLLAGGTVDGGGFLEFAANLNPQGLSPGVSLSVLSARIDVAGGRLVFGTEVDVVFRP